MTIIKSFSVGDGDMFAIRHHSDNFTIIDCCIRDDNRGQIFNDIKRMSHGKTIRRFISTHPDKDHIMGLKSFDNRFKILNFYCVKNEAKKEDYDQDFEHYCKLRDSEKASYIGIDSNIRIDSKKDFFRNLRPHYLRTLSPDFRILWPDVNSQVFINELEKVKNKESPNNISPIILLEAHGFSFMWMGDLETEFMEEIYVDLPVDLPKVDVLFAPHHGRKSGAIPEKWLKKLNPALIILGEGPSNNLFYDYAKKFNTITQNTAGDITFEIDDNKCKIYVSNENYSTKILNSSILKADKEVMCEIGEGYFLGTIESE